MDSSCFRDSLFIAIAISGASLQARLFDDGSLNHWAKNVVVVVG